MEGPGQREEDLLSECREVVDRLIEQQNLDLTPARREQWILNTAYYFRRHLDYLRDRGHNVPAGLIETIANNYHRDSPTVRALADTSSPDHDTRWVEWFRLVREWTLRVGFRRVRPGTHGIQEELRFAGGDLDIDCVEAIRKALPSFNFASRFSTWAYSIFRRQAASWLARNRSKELPSVDLGEDQTVETLASSGDVPLDEQVRLQLLRQAIERAIWELVQVGGRWLRAVYAWHQHSKGIRQVEIARELGCSKATVSRDVKAVREILRQSAEVHLYE